jgi:hypothetical protein
VVAVAALATRNTEFYAGRVFQADAIRHMRPSLQTMAWPWLRVFQLADEQGITLRSKSGKIGTVRWAGMPSQHGRIQLAYGYATTIHTAQGSTTHEHISALPSGSQAIDGLLGYSAHTRHQMRATSLPATPPSRSMCASGAR